MEQEQRLLAEAQARAREEEAKRREEEERQRQLAARDSTRAGRPRQAGRQTKAGRQMQRSPTAPVPGKKSPYLWNDTVMTRSVE